MNSFKQYCLFIFITIVSTIAYMIGSKKLIDWIIRWRDGRP
jgi:hypothetical protein